FDAAIAQELGRTPAAACRPIAPAPAPRLNFSALGSDGHRVPLASLIDKPALVHFWATWCLPCVKELPGLVKYRDAIEKSGHGRVIFISVEDEAAGGRIAKFQKDQGLDLHSYRAPTGGLADRINLGYAVPRTFLLAPDGTVIRCLQGEQDWTDSAITDRV